MFVGECNRCKRSFQAQAQSLRDQAIQMTVVEYCCADIPILNSVYNAYVGRVKPASSSAIIYAVCTQPIKVSRVASLRFAPAKAPRQRQPGQQRIAKIMQTEDHQAHGAGVVFKRHQRQQTQVEQGQHAAVDAEQA